MSKSTTQYELEFIEDLAGTHRINDNLDVIVRFASGKEYAATFFTLANIEMIMKRYALSGECLRGKYFWSSSMIIVRDLTRKTIEETVEDLLESGEFEAVFEGPAAKS